MTVTVKLKSDVASVLAQLLIDQGSCCWSEEVAMRLNIEEVERMDRKLAKLARYISDHAPGLPEERTPLPKDHPAWHPVT